MKLITKEEKDAHLSHVLFEGGKGLIYGGILSTGLYAYLKHKHPVRFKSFTPSIRAAILAMPTVSVAAFWADQGSWEFDKKAHQGDYEENKFLQDLKNWQKLSTSDKVFTVLNDHKYQIIITAWAASLYGSWVYVNKDPIMSVAQKAVQARMYAQGITIILLLSTILLAMKDEELKKKQPKPIPEWKRIIYEKEMEDKKLLQQQQLKDEHVDKAHEKDTHPSNIIKELNRSKDQESH
ncbi:unnamed protein product [Candida verbasci]|uniref:HIG1 domain-containing protein n=1 Tax=Candida verbasci TaxID=1227364 RepID=A0A9W4XKS8_9ASCO|nr:unnamed protein product [Candida verbasci]